MTREHPNTLARAARCAPSGYTRNRYRTTDSPMSGSIASGTDIDTDTALLQS
jgi:hypothetical protein